LRDGIYIAILGPPNTGKSSLLNRLAQRNAAIVSATAGTTRDVIEIHLDIGGYPAIIADTAGLRQAEGEIEREGVERAMARAAHADLKIVVLDASCGDGPDPTTLAVVDDNTLIVRNKMDLVAAGAPGVIAGYAVASDISVKTGEGLSGLLTRIQAEIGRRVETAGPPPLTRARHREALEECRSALLRAREGGAPELTAEDVRLAVRAIGRITGCVDVEDVLDVIFRDFCIGK
jgi:tRNA modification GTPase